MSKRQITSEEFFENLQQYLSSIYSDCKGLWKDKDIAVVTRDIQEYLCQQPYSFDVMTIGVAQVLFLLVASFIQIQEITE